VGVLGKPLQTLGRAVGPGTLILVLVAGTSACTSTNTPTAAPGTVATLPRTSLGTQIQFALDLVDGKVTPAAYPVHFAPPFLAQVTASQIGAVVDQLMPSAPWSLTHYLSGPTASAAQLSLTNRVGSVAMMTIQIDQGSGLITELLIQPVPAGGPASPSTALAAKASAVTSELATGQFDTVRSGFDPTMTAQLSEQQLSSAWAQVAGSLGAYEKTGDPISKPVLDGYATYFVPVTFSHGSLEVQISFDGSGQIAGLYLRPAGYDAQF